MLFCLQKWHWLKELFVPAQKQIEKFFRKGPPRMLNTNKCCVFSYTSIHLSQTFSAHSLKRILRYSKQLIAIKGGRYSHKLLSPYPLKENDLNFSNTWITWPLVAKKEKWLFCSNWLSNCSEIICIVKIQSLNEMFCNISNPKLHRKEKW